MTLAIDVEAERGSLRLEAQLDAGEGITLVIGPNGAGKSTLLECVLGVVRPRGGAIALGDRVLFGSKERIDVPTEDRRLGYVPQRYALFSHMTVAENVGFGIRGVSKRERQEQALALLDDLGVAHLADRKAPLLSGGEAQRVALARALAIRPHALLLDEPMAALDAGARRRVRRFLAERLSALDIPTIVVSHDADDVDALAGRVAVLEAGRIVQCGQLDEIESRPATRFVEDFFAREGEPSRAPLTRAQG